MTKGKMQVDSCGSRLSRLPFSEFTRKACAQYTGRRPFPLLSCVCVFAGPRPKANSQLPGPLLSEFSLVFTYMHITLCC